MDCTIIVCTKNRADSLKRTLDAILRQDQARVGMEVLVVDNGSTDHTPQVVASLAKQDTLPLRYLAAGEQGLSLARNRGVENARGDILLFIDDDAEPSGSHWAERLVDAFADDRVGAAGGDLVPVWPEGGRPDWVHEFILAPLGVTRFGLDERTELHFPQYPWGANIAYRKKSLLQLNGFSPNLGWDAAHGKMIPGEETELNLRLEREGQKIVYVPGAEVRHYIAPQKLTEAWLMDRAFGQGLSDAVIDRLAASPVVRTATLARKAANVMVHGCGACYYSLRRQPRMRIFCGYNLRMAWAYILRALHLG